MGVSLHYKIHPLFMKYSNGTSTQCHAYQYPSLFPVLFLQPSMSLFNFFIYLYKYMYSHMYMYVVVVTLHRHADFCVEIFGFYIICSCISLHPSTFIHIHKIMVRPDKPLIHEQHCFELVCSHQQGTCITCL